MLRTKRQRLFLWQELQMMMLERKAVDQQCTQEESCAKHREWGQIGSRERIEASDVDTHRRIRNVLTELNLDACPVKSKDRTATASPYKVIFSFCVSGSYVVVEWYCIK